MKAKESELCGTCKHFIGLGDWNLCCDLPHEDSPYGFLCFSNTKACDQYKSKLESSLYNMIASMEVDTKICPNCGAATELRQIIDENGVPVKGLMIVCTVCGKKL